MTDRSEYNRLYYQRNRERLINKSKQRHKENYEQNKEYFKEHNRAYREKHPQYFKEYMIKYVKANKEKLKQYYELNKDYFAKNNIKATKTESGLYYSIIKQGNGDNAKVGQKVTMGYIGKLMNGKVFDKNIDSNFVSTGAPFSFVLGQHRVIEGWDEGVQLLNKGTRATFYIPSYLAYGPRGTGGIPPNSILIFDVELINIE